MTKRPGPPAVRVQVYIENPKVGAALRREARSAKLPLSRAAEQAMQRGLAIRTPPENAAERLEALERSLADHAGRTARDLALLQELLAELLHGLALRTPPAAEAGAPSTALDAGRLAERLDRVAEPSTEASPPRPAYAVAGARSFAPRP